MNILGIMPVYNERNLLPLKAQWLVEQGINTYVLDNMSTDGSYEMLDDLPGIAGKSRINTQGSFYLSKIQREIDRILAFLKPSWVYYHGCDLYTCIKGSTIRQAVEQAVKDKNFSNVIQVTGVCNIYRMADDPDYKGLNPARTFYRSVYSPTPLSLIFAYHPDIIVYGDKVVRKNLRVLSMDGVTINLGNIKGIDEREETYQRRKLAWKMGERKNFGKHFQRAHDAGWNWTMDQTVDIRETDRNWAYQQLAETFDKVIL